MGRLALIFTLGWTAATAADLKPLLQSVEQRYNRANSLQVLFSESYSAPGRPTRTESGTLSLRKPGRMRWDYSRPEGKWFLSDGKNLYLYTPGDHRVERMKLKESDDMRAPLAFLLGRLDFDKEFRNIQMRVDEQSRTWIAAEPRNQNLPYTAVEFQVEPDARIARVRVTGHDRSVLEFAFSEEKRNPALDAARFRFTLPPGAELVEDRS